MGFTAGRLERWCLKEHSEMDEETIFQIIIGAVATGLFVGLLGLLLRLMRSARDAVINHESSIRGAAERATGYAQDKASQLAAELEKRVSKNPMHIDAEYFGQARAEYHSEDRNPGLHAKSIALVDGDEAKAEEMYIKMRAEELARK